MSTKITTTIKMSRVKYTGGKEKSWNGNEKISEVRLENAEIFIKLNKKIHSGVYIEEQIKESLPKGIKNWYRKEVKNGLIVGINGIKQKRATFRQIYRLLEKLKKSIKPILECEGIKYCEIYLYVDITLRDVIDEQYTEEEVSDEVLDDNLEDIVQALYDNIETGIWERI